MSERTRIDIEAVKAGLQATIGDVVAELIPGARLSGGQYRAGSVAGEPGSSLAIDAGTGSWIDHATGQSGGPLDLIMAVRACTFKDALRWAQDRTGAREPGPVREPRPMPPEKPLRRFDWPQLGTPAQRDLTAISRLLGVGMHGLLLALERGLLWVHAGHYVVTDSRRHVRAERRLDGEPVRLASGSATKTRTIGAATWPVGAADIGARTCVVLAEGISDFLAAHHLIACEGVSASVAVCAMLGASARIHPQALELFAGREVLIFCDADEPGRAGGRRWRDQLGPCCRRVRLYNFSGLSRDDGRPVKDLRDFLHVSADDWEDDSEVSMPVTTFIREGLRS